MTLLLLTVAISGYCQLPQVTVKTMNGKTIRTDTLTNEGKPIIIDFFATWCSPCKAMHPVLEQLKANLGDRLRIIKVDIDKHGIPAETYNVQAVPTLILFRNGQVLWRQSGAMPLNQLQAVVNQYL